MRMTNLTSAVLFLALAVEGMVLGADSQVVGDSEITDGSSKGSSPTVNDDSAASADGRVILTNAETARLRALGGSIHEDLRDQDFSLVEKALTSENTRDQAWACSAIRYFCCYPRNVPRYVRATELVKTRLSRAYVDQKFPRLLQFADAESPDLRLCASYAIGALARNTELLTADQIADACENALAKLRSDDFEDRRIGVCLLSDLICRFDVKRASEKQAVDQLLDIVEEWQRTWHSKWHDWEFKLADWRTSEKWEIIQDLALKAVLYNCEFIEDEKQALRAYQFLQRGMASQSLDLQAVPSMAALASRLPAAERRHAIDLAIAGVTDRGYWHNIGSGQFILANYAAEALRYLAPCLHEDEIQRALKAIDSQRLNAEEAKVFKPATTALRDRLAGLK